MDFLDKSANIAFPPSPPTPSSTAAPSPASTSSTASRPARRRSPRTQMWPRGCGRSRSSRPASSLTRRAEIFSVFLAAEELSRASLAAGRPPVLEIKSLRHAQRVARGKHSRPSFQWCWKIKWKELSLNLSHTVKFKTLKRMMRKRTSCGVCGAALCTQ